MKVLRIHNHVHPVKMQGHVPTYNSMTYFICSKDKTSVSVHLIHFIILSFIPTLYSHIKVKTEGKNQAAITT